MNLAQKQETHALEWNAGAISTRVHELAFKLNEELPDGGPIACIVVLKGALYFATDLMRLIQRPLIYLPTVVNSYRSGELSSSGHVELAYEHFAEAEGKHVLIIDDIFDTGLTIATIHLSIRTCNPKSVRAVTLINKQYRKTLQMQLLKLIYGFQARRGLFYYGYGMDFKEEDRALPNIYSVLKDEIRNE